MKAQAETGPGLRPALIALGVAGLVSGLAVLALILNSDHVRAPGLFATVSLLAAWSFIGTGLLAWWHRPENRVGPLLVAVGFAWTAAGLTSANAPGVFIVGVILVSLWIVLLVHLLLAFPSGRLQTRAERLVVGGAYIPGFLMGIPPLFFLATETLDECTCPANPLLISDNRGLADALLLAQGVVGAALLVAVLVLLARRWRSAAPTRARRIFAPVVWAGSITLAVFALQIPASLAGAKGLHEVVYFVLVVALATVPIAFLIAFLRTHLTREAAVSRLLGRLGDSPTRGTDLRELLAEALGDPSVSIVYWLPDSRRFVDEAGRRMELPIGGSDRAATVVEHDGRRVAALVHDPSIAEQRALVKSVTAAAALALENERLDAELRARLADLQASRSRIVEATDTERRRLERNLHDGAQQSLVALALTLRMARGKVEDRPAEAAGLIDEAMSELEHATRELRELARGIHPAVLTDRGLGAAVLTLTDRLALPVEVKGIPDERLPAAVESAAYFVVAEALTNVAKYARASRASVAIARSGSYLSVEIRDDGVGGADPGKGSGLGGLADRVSALDGRLTLESPVGVGTVVRAEIPDHSRSNGDDFHADLGLTDTERSSAPREPQEHTAPTGGFLG